MKSIIDKNSVHFYLILLGISLYYLGSLIYYYIFWTWWGARIISGLGLLLAFVGLLGSKINFSGVDGNVKPIFLFYSFVCLIVIILGVPIIVLNGRFTELLFDKFLFWGYVMGGTFLLFIKKSDLKALFHFLKIYVVSSILFATFFFGDLFLHPEEVYKGAIDPVEMGNIVNRSQEPATMLFPLGAFLVYFGSFHLKWKVIIVLSFVIALLSALLMGRRSASAILLGYALIPFLIKKIDSINNILKSISLFCFLVIILLILIPEKKLESFFNDQFVMLSSRIDADTRGGVEDDFYRDMNNPVEWVFGRGMAGTYKCPTQAVVEEKMDRYVIETGYLNMILHGGLLLLIPYAILLLYSSFVGFFYSNNFFIKSCAGYIFFRLVQLYPGGHITLSMHTFVLFIFIRLCVSSKWRKMSDLTIKRILFKDHIKIYKRRLIIANILSKYFTNNNAVLFRSK